MTIIRRLSYSVALALCWAAPVWADSVDEQRERWAVHARGGEAQLAEAAQQMGKLYQRTGDIKVRADWIALLVRQDKQAEALAVCKACYPSQYVPDELQNLAKAARDEKQFDKALALYQELQRRDASLKIGFLGGALTAVDMGNTALAGQQIQTYYELFGEDTDILMARAYLGSQSQSPEEQLAALQKRVEDNADDKDAVLQLYRLAAARRDLATQEKLISRYRKFFTDNDRLWLQEAQAAALLREGRANNDMRQLNRAYEGLSKVIEKAEAGSELYVQSKRDRMEALIALGRNDEALADYNDLMQVGRQPNHVQEQYAQALLMNDKPTTAKSLNLVPNELQDPNKPKVLFDALGNPIPPLDSTTASMAAQGATTHYNPTAVRSLQFKVLPPILQR